MFPVYLTFPFLRLLQQIAPPPKPVQTPMANASLCVGAERRNSPTAAKEQAASAALLIYQTVQ